MAARGPWHFSNSVSFIAGFGRFILSFCCYIFMNVSTVSCHVPLFLLTRLCISNLVSSPLRILKLFAGPWSRGTESLDTEHSASIDLVSYFPNPVDLNAVPEDSQPNVTFIPSPSMQLSCAHTPLLATEYQRFVTPST